MLTLLSPAKRLDFETRPRTRRHTEPAFVAEAEVLAGRMRRHSPAKLGALMGISPELARETHERFAAWRPDPAPADGRPALLAFRGDVYLGLDAPTLGAADLGWAQRRLRILSGLYGLLRPLDLILPYRLEMGLPVKIGRAASLPAYWKGAIAPAIAAALEESGGRALVNLASNEYFKAVDAKAIGAPVLTPVFKERRDDGRLQVMSFFAKRARGLMARFIVDERIDDPGVLREFRGERYRFDPKLSDERKLVFTRPYRPAT